MSIDWIPKRKINPKERGNRGFIPTSKNPSGIVEYESCLERDFYLLCDHDPHIKRFQHQPIEIKYLDKNGKKRKYTPDVFVEYINRKDGLYEIKYEAEIISKQKKYEERWNAAEEWAKENGYEFAVLTEEKIRTARRDNVWFTLGASKNPSNDQYMGKLITLIPSNGEEYNLLCSKLAEDFGIEIGKAAQILCYAIYYGFVFVDTFSTKQLSRDTIIRPKSNKHGTPFKPLWEELSISIKDQDSNNKKEDINNDFLFGNNLSKPPKKYEEEVNRKEIMVKEWLRQPSKYRNAKWREDFTNKWKCSEVTVYRAVQAYKEYGIDGLVPKHNKKGRQKKYDKTTLELVEISRKYFLKAGVTIKNAYRRLIELYREKGLDENHIPPKSYLEMYIYQNTSSSEFAQKQGRKFHKSKYTPSYASFQGAYLPMQMIQMDNTSYDVFPVDEEDRNSLSTPYMTAAIDCYTKMITGFRVSFFPSSAQTDLEVLVQSILPKVQYTEDYETQFEWSIEGFPVLILVDNGMDYRANNVCEFCKKYDIIIEYAPIRTPRYKAFIEQWFNTLHNALIDEDVEGTRPTLKRRLNNPDLKPEKNAILTLQEIETWMHKWIIDEYHYRNKYDNNVLAPILELKKVKDGRTDLILPAPREPPQLKSEVDMLYLSTLDQFTPTLQDYGVTWMHIKYNNKDLGMIFKIVGKLKVNALIDRRDIRWVWIINPINEKPIKVELASGWAQAILKMYGDKPIHKSAWIRELKLIRERNNGKISPYILGRERSWIERKELMASAKKTQKSIRKEKEKIKETERRYLQNNSLLPNEINKKEPNKAEFKKIKVTEVNISNFERNYNFFKKYKPKCLEASQYPNKNKM